MIYELRTYTVSPGRMADLKAFFRDHVLRIWSRMGIKPAGFWVGAEESNHDVLTYFLLWESAAQREVLWTAFLDDPEWLAEREASMANGPLVASVEKRFMAPTDFSSGG